MKHLLPFKSGVDYFSSLNSWSSLYSCPISSSFTFSFTQPAVQLDDSLCQSLAAFDSPLPSPHLPSPEPNTHIQTLNQSFPVHYLSPLAPLIISHPMITRSKASIFKPKRAYIITCSLKPTKSYSISNIVGQSHLDSGSTYIKC